jgi:hypothetical protein
MRTVRITKLPEGEELVPGWLIAYVEIMLETENS